MFAGIIVKDEGKAMYTFQDLIDITAKLRAEGGCSWDRAQTHESLKPYLREESEEVCAAIDNGDMENLCEELGDVLFQVMLHSQIAAEEGNFTIEDVIHGICDKMVFRHPHVFGGENNPEKGSRSLTWEELKNLDKLRKNRYKDS